MISLILTLFCLVGLIMGATKPHRRGWVVFAAIVGVPILVFYLFAVVRQISPDLTFDRTVGVHWAVLFAMIGGIFALLSKPKAPADPDAHNGASHA